MQLGQMKPRSVVGREKRKRNEIKKKHNFQGALSAFRRLMLLMFRSLETSFVNFNITQSGSYIRQEIKISL